MDGTEAHCLRNAKEPLDIQRRLTELCELLSFVDETGRLLPEKRAIAADPQRGPGASTKFRYWGLDAGGYGVWLSWSRSELLWAMGAQKGASASLRKVEQAGWVSGTKTIRALWHAVSVSFFRS